MFITAERTLIAEGNVEAFQGDTRLSASRITFDRTSGQLTIDGPIRIDQGGDVDGWASPGTLGIECSTHENLPLLVAMVFRVVC